MERQQSMHALRLCVLTICGISRSWAQQIPATDTAANSQLEEVVVTAERRSERSQDVPINVSVLSSADAQKFGNIDNLSLPTQVPGLATSRQLTGATIYLRGVGTIAAPGNENAVATYIDDVYINGFSGTVVPFNSVDHVEVLKGPQGTLFGRNATGGVIHIVTKDPSNTPALDLQAGYGNYNTYTASLYGTTGITPTLAVDLALNYRDQRHGYGKDFTTGQDVFLGMEYGIRSKVKWTPTDKTTIIVALEDYYDNYDYSLNANVQPDTLSAGGGTYAGDFNALGNNTLSGGISGHGRHIDGETITAQQELGWAMLKSISARRQVTDTTTYDQDLGPLHIVDARWPAKTEQYTEELHLGSLDGAKIADHDIHWLTGLYLYKSNDGLRPLQIAGAAVGGLPFFGATSVSDTRSYAAFVDGNFAIKPTTHLTLGFRYSDDRIKNTGNANIGFPDGTHLITPAPNQYALADKGTYRVVLDHKLTDDVMVYASTSTGFKSGGFALFGEGTPPVKPETLQAYALGLKSDWLERRLEINVEAFDYDYKNQQVEVIKAAGTFGVNAAQSRIYGLDMNMVGKVGSDLTLRANAGFLHGRYGEFAGAPFYLQNPATCTPTPTRLPGPLTPGSLTCSFDAAGKPTTRSPAFSGNVSGDYIFHFPTGNIDVAANYYYTSSYNWDPSGQYPEPAYGLLDSSLTWHTPSERYDVQAYCKNCTDKYHDAFIAESAVAIQRSGSEPRTYGIRFGAHF